MKKYLDELYEWINSLYQQTLSGQMSEEEYKKNLDYYNNEVERVNKTLVSGKAEKRKKKGISPELIQKFFEGSKETLSGSISIAANFREITRNNIGKIHPVATRNTHHKPTKHLGTDTESKEEQVGEERGREGEINLLQTDENFKNELEDIVSKPRDQRTKPQFVGLDDANKYKVIEPTPLGKVSSTAVDPSKFVKYSPVSTMEDTKGLKSPTNIALSSVSKPVSPPEKIVREITSSTVSEIINTKTKQQMTNFNFVLLGNSGVGRTSIRRAIMGKNFIKQHLSTVGASMDVKSIEIDGHMIKLTLMDLGGQDFYASVRANFYRNIHGAVIVFDLSDKGSFIQLDKWLLELYQNTPGKAIPFLLVGNKSDLKRQVKRDDAKKLAENLSQQVAKHGFKVPYLEVSAKNNEGIITIFETLARTILSLKQ